MTLISQFPFIERQIGLNKPVDQNRSVRANDHEWVKKTYNTSCCFIFLHVYFLL